MANIAENQSESVEQEEEINSLRDYFKDNIRILSSIGQFSYILKIRAEQYDVSLTLQLDKSYPKKPPEIIITAPRLAPDQISLVQQILQSYSQTLLNQSMILLIYSRLLKWFDENNIQSLTINTSNNANTNHNSTSSCIPRSPTNGKLVTPFVSVNSQTKFSHTDELTQKSSTKTIDDVLICIDSDNRFDKRYLRIGYIDPLNGSQEKPYNEFDFKSESTTNSDRQINLLSNPKYRIKYIKYNNEIIWDKDNRIDLLFGSTGNQQTIDDVIKRHENIIEKPISPNDETPDTDNNSPIKRYLTSTDALYKPNYVLSIPITDPTVISRYYTYREHLLSMNSSTSSQNLISIDPHYLHLTLLTLRLDSPSQIEQLILALKRIQEEIHYHCSYPERICLEFNGIDTFHGKTVFVKCEQNIRLENLRQLIIERLCEQKQKQKMNETFFAGNYQEYIPHIILYKSKRKLSTVYQAESNSICFGKQTINALILSSASTNENEQQNNHCIFKLDLS